MGSTLYVADVKTVFYNVQKDITSVLNISLNTYILFPFFVKGSYFCCDNMFGKLYL